MMIRQMIMAVLLLQFSCWAYSAETKRVLPPAIKVAKASNFSLATGINNPVWNKQPGYAFMKLACQLDDLHRTALEEGVVKFLYDDNYFYVRAELTDSDVVNNARANGGFLYRDGDLLEVFVKPVDKPYYWEIYGTPNKLFSCFHYRSRGTLGLATGFIVDDCKILVDARVNGTMNDPRDVDRSWTVLIAIPAKELTRHGAAWTAGSKWQIMAARYNYSRYLSAFENSSYPQVPFSNHALEHYAVMELLK